MNRSVTVDSPQPAVIDPTATGSLGGLRPSREGSMIYAFGEFALDDQRYQLQQSGEVVKIEPQAFKLLAYLLAHPTRVISREELFEKLWPGQVVSDVAGCSKDSGQEEARRTLQRLGIPYSREAFVERVRSGDPLAVALFVATGMDPDERDTSGATPLMRFALEGNADAVQRLITKGANVNAQDKNGHTALLGAAGYGRTNVVQMWIDNGADVNAQGNEGETVLMQAVLNGHPAVVKLLLDKGADVSAKTRKGKTALSYAQEQPPGFIGGEGRREVVALLKQAGAEK